MRILWLSLVLLIWLQLSTAQSEPTTLIFYYEHQDQQKEDYIQVELQVQTENPSLTKTINEATSTVAEIKTIAMDYCRQNKVKKGDCKEAAEVQRFQIEPKYQKIRREDSFSSFIVSHKVTVNVFNPERIGSLVDSLLKISGVTLEGFEWVPFEEVDKEEAAIKAGLEEADELCEELGLQLSRVVNVEEIIQDTEQQQEKTDEQQEQQEQQQQQKVVYKLEVECAKASKKSQK